MHVQFCKNTFRPRTACRFHQIYADDVYESVAQKVLLVKLAQLDTINKETWEGKLISQAELKLTLLRQ